MGIDKSTGYNYIYRPNHPNAKQNGMVAEHVYVLSKKIGRPLRKGEQCHHLDGNKLNNKEDNLQLTTLMQHYYMHRERKDARPCHQCGKDTKNLKYCSVQCSQIGQQRVERPTPEILLKMVEEEGYCAVGRRFNVSDNSIRKWLRHQL